MREPSRDTFEADLRDGGAWMTAARAARLFGCTETAVRRSAERVLRDEMEGEMAVARFATLEEGEARYPDHYSLEMVMAVGLRIRGRGGRAFRRWALGVLRDHLKKGTEK